MMQLGLLDAVDQIAPPLVKVIHPNTAAFELATAPSGIPSAKTVESVPLAGSVRNVLVARRDTVHTLLGALRKSSLKSPELEEHYLVELADLQKQIFQIDYSVKAREGVAA